MILREILAIHFASKASGKASVHRGSYRKKYSRFFVKITICKVLEEKCR
jgi:hypothetical protein